MNPFHPALITVTVLCPLSQVGGRSARRKKAILFFHDKFFSKQKVFASFMKIYIFLSMKKFRDKVNPHFYFFNSFSNTAEWKHTKINQRKLGYTTRQYLSSLGLRSFFFHELRFFRFSPILKYPQKKKFVVDFISVFLSYSSIASLVKKKTELSDVAALAVSSSRFVSREGSIR